MSETATRNLTILLTDIKGFTDKTSHKSRAAITTMLDDHRAVVLPILEQRGGRLIKTIGDAFLMTFESPTDAVLAGVAVQGALAERNEGRGVDDRLEIRIAINAGEVNVIDGDVFGEAVNITARIEGIAEAGQVYFTEAVYLAMNKTEVPSSEVGLVQLKGIPEKIRVYKVRREAPPIIAASAATPEVRKGAAKAVMVEPTSSTTSFLLPRRAAALTIDLLLCAAVAAALVGPSLVSPSIVEKKVEKKVEVTLPGKDLGVGDIFLDRLSGRPIKGGRKEMRSTFVTEKVAEPRPWGRALAYFGLVLLAYSVIFLKLLGATPGSFALSLPSPRRDPASAEA